MDAICFDGSRKRSPKSRSLLACTRAYLNLWIGPTSATKLSPAAPRLSLSLFLFALAPFPPPKNPIFPSPPGLFFSPPPSRSPYISEALRHASSLSTRPVTWSRLEGRGQAVSAIPRTSGSHHLDRHRIIGSVH